MQEVILHFDKEDDYRTREAFKTLRTNIEFSGNDLKVVSVTSCTPNEGKSSIAMNMARAFAEAGSRTLIVDADMRKSVLVGRYKTGAVKRGLTHYLIGKASTDDVICKSNIKNLFLAFSGPVPPNPSELIGGDGFKDFIAEVKRDFDCVIIDTPPLGSVIDAAVAAKHCDGTILVIESNAVSYRFVQRVKEQLDKTGCRILGVVLNKVDMSTKGYYGHYGRYYGKYYGKYYGRYGEENKDSIESSVNPRLNRTARTELSELEEIERELKKAGVDDKETLPEEPEFEYIL